MKQKKNLKNNILQLTEGVFSTTIDCVLWMVAFSLEMMTPKGYSGAVYRSVRFADTFIEELNYQRIKQALNNARRKGLLTTSIRKVNPQITEQGRKRLAAIVPSYDEKRVWDGRLYLVTYDIPEKKKKTREVLRDYLKRIGCGMIQKSVWLAPYNPQKVLEEFIRERGLEGTVIISTIGKDGSIGNEDVGNLIARIYRLDHINKRYREFIEEHEGESEYPAHVMFKYLSILKDDPQLPFKLLPEDWLGDKAYLLYKSNLFRLGINLS